MAYVIIFHLQVNLKAACPGVELTPQSMCSNDGSRRLALHGGGCPGSHRHQHGRAFHVLRSFLIFASQTGLSSFNLHFSHE